jgi:hypothetical protein
MGVEVLKNSILIETDKVSYVIGVSNKGKFFNLLVLERDKANIGIARALIEKSKTPCYGLGRTTLAPCRSIFQKHR